MHHFNIHEGCFSIQISNKLEIKRYEKAVLKFFASKQKHYKYMLTLSCWRFLERPPNVLCTSAPKRLFFILRSKVKRELEHGHDEIVKIEKYTNILIAHQYESNFFYQPNESPDWFDSFQYFFDAYSVFRLKSFYRRRCTLVY